MAIFPALASKTAAAAAVVLVCALFAATADAQCECITSQCIACTECNTPERAHLFPLSAESCSDVPVNGTACPDDWSDGIIGGRTTGDDSVDPDFIKCDLSMRRCPHLFYGLNCNLDNRRGALFPYGVDASLLTSREIASLSRVSDAVGANIASYASHTGTAAVSAMCGCAGHTVTDAEALDLFIDILELRTTQVKEAYEAQREPTSAVWSGVSKCYRTAMVAVFWDRALPDGAPLLWQRALQNDWHSVIKYVYLLECYDDVCNKRKQNMGRMLEVCRRACTVDFMMVQDETVSLNNAEFAVARSAIHQVADGFGDLSTAGVRIGLEAFAVYRDCDRDGTGNNCADGIPGPLHRVIFSMTTHAAKAAYLNDIDTFVREGGCCKTYTPDAVVTARDSLLAQARPLGENVPRVELTVTDGLSHLSPEARAAGYTNIFVYEDWAFQQLQLHNITAFCIGVLDANALANKYDRIKQEVETLAGGTERAYLATSFDLLPDIAEAVAGQVCLAHAVATPGTIHINPGETRYLASVLPDCGVESAHVVIATNVLTGEIDLFGSHNESIKNPNPGLFHVSTNGPAGTNTSLTLSGDSYKIAYLAIRSSSLLISDAQLTMSSCCGIPCFPPTPTPQITESGTKIVTKTPMATPTITRPVVLMWRREQYLGGAAELDGFASVTLLGQEFKSGDAFQISTTVNCTDGEASAVAPVWRWTDADPEEDLAIPFKTGINGSYPKVFVCYSADNGTSWVGVPSPAPSQPWFEIWPGRAPVWSTLTPSLPTANATLLMALHNVNVTTVNAVLTTDRYGCMHSPPAPIVGELISKRQLHLEKRDAVVLSFPEIGFAADAVYLCVSQDNVSWSLAIEDTPSGGTIGRPGFPVRAVELRGRQAVITCNDAFTGVPVTCTMCIDDGVLCVSPLSEDCEVADLIDGNGVAVCPLPLLRATNGSHAEFSFVPQFAGRAGSLALSCNGFIVPALPTPQQEALEAINNGTTQVGTTCAGLGLGDAGGASLFGVTSAGMRIGVPVAVPLLSDADIAAIAPVGAPSIAALSSDPIEWLPALHMNGTGITANETYVAEAVRALPLHTTSCQLGILARVSPPAFELRVNATRDLAAIARGVDRVLADVHLLGNDGTTVGHWVIAARPAGDGGVSKNVLAAAPRELFLTHSVWEKVAGFAGIPRAMTAATVRVTFRASAAFDLGWRIAFAEPSLKCEGSVTPFTPPTEVAALEAIAAAVLPGPMSTAAGWDVGQTDPCLRFWRGVECRHSHVVGLRLSHVDLKGTLPMLTDLPFLELVEIRQTNLTGDVGSQLEFNSRMKVIDVSHNNVTTITLPQGRLRCMQRLLAFNNSIQGFPANAERLPQLTDLNLGHNKMTGFVPGLAHSPKLGVVLLGENQLSGGLPTAPPTVSVIDVHGNQFTGALPFQWQYLRAARVVDVSGNQLDHPSLRTVRLMPAGPKMRFVASLNKYSGALPNLGVRIGDVGRNDWMCPLPLPGLEWPLQFLDLHDLQCVENGTVI